jgi:drug/metabolite transporter (DMT)-like permease
LNFRDLFETVLALIVFASAYALIRIALTELPPLTVAAIRFLLASSLMIPFVMIRYRERRPRVTRFDLAALFGLSIVQIFLPNVLQNIGLEYTTASVSSVLQSTAPVFTLILSFTMLGESIGAREVLGVILGMTGVVLLSTGGNVVSLSGSVFLGNVLQIGVAASYAISGIVGKIILRKYAPMFVVTITFVVGAVLLSACATMFERNLWPQQLSEEVIIALLLLSLLYCLALVSWYDVLQRTGVFRLYILLFTMPVLAVIISIIVLAESFTPTDILFSAMTLLGVAVVQVGKRK